jgi:hypothetical protein
MKTTKQTTEEILRDALSLYENGSFTQAREEIKTALTQAIQNDEELSEISESISEEASDPIDFEKFVSNAIFRSVKARVNFSF